MRYAIILVAALAGCAMTPEQQEQFHRGIAAGLAGGAYARQQAAPMPMPVPQQQQCRSRWNGSQWVTDCVTY